MASLWRKMKLLVNSRLTNLVVARHDQRVPAGAESADSAPTRPGDTPVATAFTPEEARIFVRFLADQSIPATLAAPDPATGHIAIHTAPALADSARAALRAAGLIATPPEAPHDHTP